MIGAIAALHRAMILIQTAISELQRQQHQREIYTHVLQTKRECADTRDRIEHLIERMQALEQKVSAVAEQDERRREEGLQAIMQALELQKPEGGATSGTDGTD